MTSTLVKLLRGFALIMRLFHLFFPSWRFFENTGDFIGIEYRFGTSPNLDPVDWNVLFPPQPRSWFRLLWNPLGNEILTINNHANQVILQISQTKDIEVDKNFSFQIIKKYVAIGLGVNSHFQFKIVGHQLKNSLVLSKEDLVISEVFQGPPK